MTREERRKDGKTENRSLRTVTGNLEEKKKTVPPPFNLLNFWLVHIL